MAAREERPSIKVPHEWAMTTMNIAMIQKKLADHGSDPAATTIRSSC